MTPEEEEAARQQAAAQSTGLAAALAARGPVPQTAAPNGGDAGAGPAPLAPTEQDNLISAYTQQKGHPPPEGTTVIDLGRYTDPNTPNGLVAVTQNPDGRTSTIVDGEWAGTHVNPPTTPGQIIDGRTVGPSYSNVTRGGKPYDPPGQSSRSLGNTIGDFGLQVGTLGLVGLNPDGSLTPGTTGKPLVDAGGEAVDAIGDALGGLAGGGGEVDPGAKSEVDRANALADALGVEREKAGAHADADRGRGLETRDLQYRSIGDLQDAASGKVASAAELALTRQSGIDAARQQGLAAALQGNNPAAALRQASMGAAKVAGDTAANAAQLRANEQATARTALANAIAGARQQDQGAVNTDVTQQGNAQQGQTTSQGQGVTAEGNILTRQSEKDKADAIREGALISAGGAFGTTLLSDKRAKEQVRRTDLADAIGKEVHGVEFTYRPGQGDGDRHVGLIAQELERVMPGVVKRDADGMRQVDAGHLTMSNTATLAELARRIKDLEGAAGRKKGRAA